MELNVYNKKAVENSVKRAVEIFRKINIGVNVTRISGALIKIAEIEEEG